MSDSLIDLMWLFYFIDKFSVEDYNDFFGFWLLFGCIISAILVAVKFTPDGDKDEFFTTVGNKVKPIRHILLIPLLYTLYYNVVPSKETAWTMTGIYMASKVVNNPEVVDLTSEGYKILENKVKLYSIELEEEVQEAINNRSKKEK